MNERATDRDDIVLCDIRDVEALQDVFRRHRPEVVLHAAALKHLRRFLEESRAPTSDSEVARARLEADRLIAAFEAKLTGGR